MPRYLSFLGVMISGGLRFYNARLVISGFVSTVRPDRVTTGWSDPALLLPSFLISSAHLVAVSLPCPPHDCPYYENLYHSLLYAAAWTMKFLGSKSLRAVREPSLSRVSCLDLCLVLSWPDQPCPSGSHNNFIRSRSSLTVPNSRRYFLRGKSIFRHRVVSRGDLSRSRAKFVNWIIRA